jgi:hypothetical protein
MMELIQQLMVGAGVNQAQAEGGVGLLLGLLKEQLPSSDFAKVDAAVPEAETLIDAAPASGSGGLSGLLGSAVSALGGTELGNLASLASGFSKLDLDIGTIGKFIPVLLAFLQSKGGDDLAGMVSRVLQGE